MTDGTATRRIGIFADGIVGSKVLSKFIEHAPQNLVALVVNSELLLENAHLPASCDIRRWDGQDEAATVEWLRTKELDTLILVWWPYLLRGEILKTAPLILNTHPSLLPYCRGKDPNFWAIVEHAPYGVSLHQVNAAIDAGNIAFQRKIPVSWSDTGGSLYQKGLDTIVDLFDEALPSIIDGTVPLVPQPQGGSLHYRKQLSPALSIDLDAPTTARELLDRLRAGTFPPFPACRFTDDGTDYEVTVSINPVSGRED